MKPLIGIASRYLRDKDMAALSKGYYNGIEASGGIPVIIPPLEDMNGFERLLSKLDGLLLSGGPDVAPILYGENPLPEIMEISPERDFSELNLIREGLIRGIPIFGICRGLQILAVAAGGTLYQDIYSQHEAKLLKHSQEAPQWHGTHKAHIEDNSLLMDIFKTREILVNSYHHQSIKKVPEGFKVNAIAPDGIIEGMESKSHPFVIGVQWHPEMMWEKHPQMLKLFERFILECKRVYE